MLNDVINLILYIFNSFINLFFSMYIMPGVSLGMIVVVVGIFIIIIRYLLSIPNSRGSNEKGSSSSNSSNS